MKSVNVKLYVGDNQLLTTENTVPSEVADLSDGQELKQLVNAKQDELVSGTNIKTINGSSVLGEGDLEVVTYQPFPNNWRTSGTMAELFTDIKNDTDAVPGMSYLGEVRCSNLPFAGNAEMIINIMTGSGNNKVMVGIVTSANICPYYWQYTYGAGYDTGWQTFISADNSFPAFSRSSTYQNGDIVTYVGKFYKCHTDIVSPGSWTGSTNWDLVNLGDIINGVSSGNGPHIYQHECEINGAEFTILSLQSENFSSTPINFGLILNARMHIDNDEDGYTVSCSDCEFMWRCTGRTPIKYNLYYQSIEYNVNTGDGEVKVYHLIDDSSTRDFYATTDSVNEYIQ